MLILKVDHRRNVRKKPFNILKNPLTFKVVGKQNCLLEIIKKLNCVMKIQEDNIFIFMDRRLQARKVICEEGDWIPWKFFIAF